MRSAIASERSSSSVLIRLAGIVLRGGRRADVRRPLDLDELEGGGAGDDDPDVVPERGIEGDRVRDARIARIHIARHHLAAQIVEEEGPRTALYFGREGEQADAASILLHPDIAFPVIDDPVAVAAGRVRRHAASAVRVQGIERPARRDAAVGV